MNAQWRIALVLVMMAIGLPILLVTVKWAYVGLILVVGGATIGVANAIQMKASQKQSIAKYQEAK